MKICPFCAEEIQDAAIKCRYCGEFLQARPVAEPTPATEHVRPRSQPAKSAPGKPLIRRSPGLLFVGLLISAATCAMLYFGFGAGGDDMDIPEERWELVKNCFEHVDDVIDHAFRTPLLIATHDNYATAIPEPGGEVPSKLPEAIVAPRLASLVLARVLLSWVLLLSSVGIVAAAQALTFLLTPKTLRGWITGLAGIAWVIVTLAAGLVLLWSAVEIAFLRRQWYAIFQFHAWWFWPGLLTLFVAVLFHVGGNEDLVA